MIIIHHIHPADTFEEVSSEPWATVGTYEAELEEESQVAIIYPFLLQGESLWKILHFFSRIIFIPDVLKFSLANQYYGFLQVLPTKNNAIMLI